MTKVDPSIHTYPMVVSHLQCLVFYFTYLNTGQTLISVTLNDIDLIECGYVALYVSPSECGPMDLIVLECLPHPIMYTHCIVQCLK